LCTRGVMSRGGGYVRTPVHQAPPPASRFIVAVAKKQRTNHRATSGNEPDLPENRNKE